MSNNLDRQYLDLLQDILDNGVRKDDRTGTGTLSVFGRQIRHKMSEGFPLLTTKKMAFKTMVVELLWFLRGDTDIRYLWQNNCFIWDGDWYLNYCKKTSSPYSLEEMKEFALNPDKYPIRSKFFSKDIWNLGSTYGVQWRNWSGDNFIHGDFRNGIDQIQNLINDLKTNPDSRRLMVNAWNVGELSNMVLPPCHYGFQVYTKELDWYMDLEKIKNTYIEWSLLHSDGISYMGDLTVDTKLAADTIFTWGWWDRKDPFGTGKLLTEHECFDIIPKRTISLMFNMRSTDVPLGLPFNLASYGLLLEILAKEVNMIPDELIANLGDTHIYLNQLDGVKEQLTRQPYELPKLEIRDVKVDDISQYEPTDFELLNYRSHPKIHFPLSN